MLFRNIKDHFGGECHENSRIETNYVKTYCIFKPQTMHQSALYVITEDALVLKYENPHCLIYEITVPDTRLLRLRQCNAKMIII